MAFQFDPRADVKFQAVMTLAKETHDHCTKRSCRGCLYHRTARDDMMVVCFCEKLTDRLIEAGLIDGIIAKAMMKEGK